LQVFQRRTGKQAGGWYTTITGPRGARFRSRKEIERHLERSGEAALLARHTFSFNPFGGE
jgi:hypothetical protein